MAPRPLGKARAAAVALALAVGSLLGSHAGAPATFVAAAGVLAQQRSVAAVPGSSSRHHLVHGGSLLPQASTPHTSSSPTLQAPRFAVAAEHFRNGDSARAGAKVGTGAGTGTGGRSAAAAAASTAAAADAGKPNKQSDEYRFAIHCDTPDGCKLKLAENKIQCCKLCLDDTSFFGHDPNYGFYEFVEKDPWAPVQDPLADRTPANEAAEAGQAPSTSGAGGSGGNDAATAAGGSAEEGGPGSPALRPPGTTNLDRPTQLDRPGAAHALPPDNPTLKAERTRTPPPPENGLMDRCLPPQEDDFRLPCCQFCPRSAMSDSGMPFLMGSRFSSTTNLLLPKVPCCAAPGSCCRWCPEYVCPYLQEYTLQTRLWWHICGSWNQDNFPKDWQTNTIGKLPPAFCPRR